ncbi:hypothetical protein EMCRGX_G018494 [Ephydatia muelleri]
MLTCLPVAFDKCQKKERGYSIVVVVSPLVAIMKDQVSTYSIKGLKTTYMYVSQSGEVTDKSVLDEVSQGNFQLVFFTPEMLIGSKRWRNMLTGHLYSERLKAFVIDEAHCVKKWGTTFRHVLARVGEVRSLIPSSVHVMALTATATSSDRIAVTQMIGLQNPYTLKQAPSKPNIVYQIGSFKTVPDTFKKIADRLSFCQPPGCTRHPRIPAVWSLT